MRTRQQNLCLVREITLKHATKTSSRTLFKDVRNESLKFNRGIKVVKMQKLYCKHIQNDYYTIVRIVHLQLHPCEDWALNESGFTIYLTIPWSQILPLMLFKGSNV